MYPIRISDTRFTRKPTKQETGLIVNELNKPSSINYLEIEEIADLISQGYTVQPGICRTSDAASFERQQLFFVDIDNDKFDKEPETFESYFNKLERHGIEGAFGYESFNSRKFKHPETGEEIIKFRVIIPCQEEITSDEERFQIISALIGLSEQADIKCKNANRIYYGNNKGILDDFCNYPATNSKESLLALPLPDDYIYIPPEGSNYSSEGGAAPAAGASSRGADSCKWGQPIEVHERNDVLSARAFALLKSNYPDQERAWSEFLKSVDECEEPLPASEVHSVWEYAKKSFNRKIINNPNVHLVPRSEYRANKDKGSYFPKDWTDVGQSKVFAQVYKDKLLYTPEWGFLYYNGEIYQKKSKEYAQHLAQELTDLQLQELENKRDQLNRELDELKDFKDSDMAEAKEKRIEREQKELNKTQHKIESMRNGSHIKSTVEFSKARLTIDKEKLDSNPWELNTPAGIIDLKTGEMRERSSKDLLTKITSVSPSNKGREEWIKFIKSITNWNCPRGQEHIYRDQSREERSQELCEYLQVVTGLSLIGEIIIEGLFLHYGETGANGKSTLFSVLLHSIGDYGVTIDVNDFLLNKINNPFSSAALDGVRFAECNEPPFNVPMDGAATKRFTSRDTIPAQRKYMDAYNFKPTHTTHMTANLLPKWNFKDKGVERRLFPIPYNAHFEGDKCDPLLEQKLIDHCSEAALQWMIEGAVKFYEAGCTLEPFIPEFINRLKQDWINENNSVKAFIEECCIVDHSDKNKMTKTKTFHEALQKYLRQNYLPYMNARQIRAEMELLGFERKRADKERNYYYLNVEIDYMP